MSSTVSKRLGRLQRAAEGFGTGWGRVGVQMAFYSKTIAEIRNAFVHYKLEIVRLIAQMSMGTGALAVIGGTVVIIGFLTLSAGAIIAVQGYNSLSGIGVEALTGFISAYANVRIIAPVVAGIGLAATIGAGATAQLGAMRISEEIDALEVMGIRSIAYLASTRVVAGVIVVIPLYCIAVLMSFFAARMGTTFGYGQSTGVYDHYFNTFLHSTDLIWSFFQAIVIGIVVMLVHTFYGFTATGGPAGVGEAVGRAVRTSLIAAAFVSVIITLSVYGQSGNFDLSGVTAMFDDRDGMRIKPAWWTAILLLMIVGLVLMTFVFFTGAFRTFVPVTLTADRSGLILESGGKVKMRGVQVGRIASVTGTGRNVSVRLNMFPDAVADIPANVDAQIRATTAFGSKYVDLIYPDDPSPQPLSAGTVLTSRNVSTEVNTVFENLSNLITKLDPMKLNATLTALADGVRGQGERIGQATTDANQVLLAVNPRMDTVAADWRALGGFSDTYSAAAQDIMKVLDSASVTSTTVTDHAGQLNTALLNSIGFAQSGITLLGQNTNSLVHLLDTLVPTTDVLHKYDSTLTCTLQGAVWFLNNGGKDAMGGNGRSVILDAALLPGDDPYKYPANLPIVAAKGGPGGQPGCGSLPDPSKNFPVRQLVTDTGWGTGLDWRPNPGIGHPWLVNWFPVTKGVPEPPRIHGDRPPAIGPVPYPGAPPYGAPLYGPDGAPLYPPPP